MEKFSEQTTNNNKQKIRKPFFETRGKKKTKKHLSLVHFFGIAGSSGWVKRGSEKNHDDFYNGS